MARIAEQMLKCSVTLTTKQAVALRDLGVELDYRCPNPECNAPVLVVTKGKDKAGVKYKAHFEHRKRNPKCHYGVGIRQSAADVQAVSAAAPGRADTYSAG
ncbi:MAG TPA: hypothetical protein VK574_20800 [Terracidiphilus sp.]|nr:hypothetical protein [Terracidiphilus sp.]